MIATELAVTELSYSSRRRTTYRLDLGELGIGPVAALGSLSTWPCSRDQEKLSDPNAEIIETKH